ncbi:T9SS type A sorting domain-containing protein [Ekhidna sp.]|uniref:T9SS type A sorting domain-containing protein n=1 Tax=Ekhidna sp. TaxID=2608089 RepID=UPI003CCC245D
MVTRIITFLVLSLAVCFTIKAQQLSCGTPEPTAEQLERFKDLGKNGQFSFDAGRISSTTSLAIAAHVIRKDDGTGGLTETELNDAIDNLNTFYSNAGLSFFILTINYIDNTKYFDFVQADQGEMTAANNFENTINIYFANSVSDGDGAYFCGYAYFPGGPDVILMDNGCSVNGSTLPHEVGHFFALYHTHGTSNSTLTDELVTRGTGANCDTAGDQLCDTAADPKLTGNVNSSCQYTGTETDANGDAFTPDPANIMSYSLKQCRDVFTDGQYSRMNEAYTNNRNYLRQSNYVADFNYDLSAVCSGDEVSFTNKSINADAYAWVFEGGDPATSTEENPVVVYNSSGTFSVELTITSGGETETKSISNAIQVDEELSSTVTEATGSFEESEIQEKIVNADNGITWQQSTNVSSEGSKSMFIDFFNYQDQSQEDYLVFATLNTSSEKSFELMFDYAYSPYSNTYYDGLAIVYKGSCESTWNSVYYKEGTDLQTTPDFTTSQFVPEASDWKQEIVSFDIPEGFDVVEVAFKGVNGWGNALYVDNYSVTAASAISVSSLEVQNTSCPDASDGSIVITASGNGPFEYSMDGNAYSEINEFENLEVGQYEIGIRDINQTEITRTVDVSFENDYPEKPVIETGNDELIVQIEGDQTVTWYVNGEIDESTTSAIYSNPETGTYAAEVSNGDCGTMSDTFEVQEVSIQSVNVINTSCPDVADGAVSIVASGTAPYEYSFNDSEYSDQSEYPDLLPGTYMVSLKNFMNDPITQAVQVLSENEYPELPVITESGGVLSITLIEGQSAQWYLDGTMIPDETSSSIDNLDNGAYTVEVSNGSCATLSEPYIVLGLDRYENNVSVFPNPVASELSISFKSSQSAISPQQIVVTDLAGRVIIEKEYSDNLDVSDLKSGIYLLHLKSSEQNVVKRFVKQ